MITRRTALTSVAAAVATGALTSACPSSSRSPMPSPSPSTGAKATAPLSTVDVVIIGGGPAGLAAALALGRARRTVLLCDAGPRRNAKAIHLHNFVTRDGTPPDDFRAASHRELEAYDTVTRRDVVVRDITKADGANCARERSELAQFPAPADSDGDDGHFTVTLDDGGVVRARRVLLATGMVDRVDEVGIDGFARFWGDHVFQCPYCHGFEVRQRRWGFLALNPHGIAHGFPLLLRHWTDDVVVFTNGEQTLTDEQRELYARAGIAVETAPITALVGADSLQGVTLKDTGTVPVEVLFAHPKQRQVAVVDGLVRSLGLAVDEHGFLQTNPMTGATSVAGIFAAGDLASGMQGAIMAAATGTRVASMIAHDLAIARFAVVA